MLRRAGFGHYRNLAMGEMGCASLGIHDPHSDSQNPFYSHSCSYSYAGLIARGNEYAYRSAKYEKE